MAAINHDSISSSSTTSAGGGPSSTKNTKKKPLPTNLDPNVLVNRVFGGKFRKALRVPGMNLKSVAKKRISFLPINDEGVDNQLSPRDRLKALGVVENDLTKPLFEYADRKTLCPGLPVTAVAKKFVDSLGLNKMNALEDLNSDNLEISHAGIVCRYFGIRREDQGDAQDAANNDEELRYTRERGQLLQDIQDWLGEVPDGHARFYHGTGTVNAASICSFGVNQAFFDPTADFGQAFYCSKHFEISFDYAETSKYEGEVKGAIMTFDIPEATYENMRALESSGDQWKHIVRFYRKNVRSQATPIDDNVDVVVGLVSDPAEGFQDPPNLPGVTYNMHFARTLAIDLCRIGTG